MLNHFCIAANTKLFLLVQNDGDNYLEVNATIFSVKTTFQVIKVPEHDVEKVGLHGPCFVMCVCVCVCGPNKK